MHTEVKKTETEKQIKKVSQQKSQKSLESQGLGKVSIPKLNLAVLPNYHKKS